MALRRQQLLYQVLAFILSLNFTHNWLMNDVNYENDFRFISYEDLLDNADHFADENITTFSRLLFDVAGDQIIVGARDMLYRMSVNLRPLQVTPWEASQTIVKMCQDKGQSERDCRNYVMVLQTYGNVIYACGTHAFSPNCSYRQIDNLSAVTYVKGVAKCPFSPHANVTSLMTESGQLFIGSPTDFSGSDPAILRANVSEMNDRILRTKQYNSNWLNDPQFVGSFEAGKFVYFVFRETAIETTNCGKMIYSRIARVCKSDFGGDHILKDNWTTFLKARLNCSLPGKYPFYFDEVQSITYSPDEQILYATFTTPENLIHGSAVCAFNLSAINLAFSGPFKHQENINSAWESVNSPYRAHYECKQVQGSGSYNHLLYSSRYQLMDRAVQPISSQPLYFSKLERLYHIALDIISTKVFKNMNILFVATDNGLVKKISILPDTKQTCVIEVWQVEQQNAAGILTVQFLKETESLYIGTERNLLRVPAQHCSRHVSKTSCLNAMDPYCGWNELQEACTASPNGDTSARYWLQNSTMCPVLTAPVDGSWSSWSDWFKCAQNNGQIVDSSASNVDACLCRTRSCNNPTPKNGGADCKGIHIEVSNCTVNGGWTEWSAWSACSQTCGVAVKTRRRTCGNPKPAHGGRVCVGSDRAEIYCSHLPPCPVPKQPPIDGGWGPWGSWGDCSSPCGGGFKMRRRKCNDPEPQNGGLDCSGCHIEYEMCNTHSCIEHKKLSTWTPWLVTFNETLKSNDEHLEKRFRFACRATTLDPNSLRVTVAKEETRVCKNSGMCQRSFDTVEDHTWSDWSPCSVSCGGGQQFRVKLCDKTNCEGKTKVARACNTQPCSGWGCWDEWSPCSVTCGIGIRRRHRKCLSPEGNCEGRDTQEDSCEMPSCDLSKGWSNWSEWTNCSPEENMEYRYRKCTAEIPGPLDCTGEDFEKRPCIGRDQSDAVVTAGIMCASIIGTALVSSIMSIVLTYILMKKYYNKNSSRHSSLSSTYDAFSNQYCSLPTKDNLESKSKMKRQPSLNSECTIKGGGNLGGTLAKNNNMQNNYTPKALSRTYTDFEASTLKRNSHGLNNKSNRSSEDDKF